MTNDAATEMDDVKNPENPKVDLRDYVDSRIDDLKELVDARLNALALAVEVARTEVNRRLEGMNELRDQITDERGEFVKLDMLDQRLAQLAERITRAEFGRGKPPSE